MQTLEKLSRRILSELSSHGKTNYSCAVASSALFSGDTTIPQLAVTLKSNETTVRRAISHLIEQGYLTPFDMTLPNGGKIVLGVYLSHKGLHYKELSALDRRQTLLKSVWLPILVSIATNITVSVLQWLWPLIIQWLSSFHG